MKLTITTFAAIFAFAFTAAAQSTTGTTGTTGTTDTTATTGTTTTGTTGSTTGTALGSGTSATDQAELFRQLDTNADGSLSREEFARLPSISGGTSGTGARTSGSTATDTSTSGSTGTNTTR